MKLSQEIRLAKEFRERQRLEANMIEWIDRLRKYINRKIQRINKLESEIESLQSNRDYFCGRINDIAKVIGMTGKDHFSPDAILRNVESIQQKCKRMEKALQFYAHADNWISQETGEMVFAGLDTLVPKECHPIMDDKGEIARQALKELK